MDKKKTNIEGDFSGQLAGGDINNHHHYSGSRPLNSAEVQDIKNKVLHYVVIGGKTEIEVWGALKKILGCGLRELHQDQEKAAHSILDLWIEKAESENTQQETDSKIQKELSLLKNLIIQYRKKLECHAQEQEQQIVKQRHIKIRKIVTEAVALILGVALGYMYFKNTQLQQQVMSHQDKNKGCTANEIFYPIGAQQKVRNQEVMECAKSIPDAPPQWEEIKAKFKRKAAP